MLEEILSNKVCIILVIALVAVLLLLINSLRSSIKLKQHKNKYDD